MRAGSEELGDSLDRSRGLQHDPARYRAGQALPEIIKQECGSFDTNQVDDLEPAGGQLRAQLAGAMRVATERARKQRRNPPGCLYCRQLGLGLGIRLVN